MLSQNNRKIVQAMQTSILCSCAVALLVFVPCANSRAGRPIEASNMVNERPRAAVSSPVRVTPPGSPPHFWWSLRTSPKAQEKMVICATRNQPRDARLLENVIYGSTDGGQTWNEIFNDKFRSLTSEVACGIGGDGTIFFSSTSGYNRGSNKTRTATFYRSSDDGKTWSSWALPFATDSARLTYSVESGRVHIFFNDGDAVEKIARRFVRSNDGGRTFEKEKYNILGVRGETGKKRIIWLGDALALESGRLGSVWLDPKYNEIQPIPLDKPATRVTYNVVEEDGSSNIPAIVVDELSRDLIGVAANRINEPFLKHPWPAIAEGPLPWNYTRNRLYLVWHDLVDGRMRVQLATSDNEGKSWSEPRIIDDALAKNEGQRGANAGQPTIAVNRFGVVAVQWGEMNGGCWRIAISIDGGATFGPSTELDRCSYPSLLKEDRISSSLAFGRNRLANDDDPSTISFGLMDWRLYWGVAHNSGIAATAAGTFQSSWVSVVDGGDFGIFTATVEPPMPITQTCLSGREYFSDMQKFDEGYSEYLLEYASMHYDVENRILSMSMVPLIAGEMPDALFFELEELSSSLGSVEAVNADNGERGSGALWIFPANGRKLNTTSSATYQYLDQERLRYAGVRSLQFRLLTPPKKVAIRSSFLANDILDVKGRWGTIPCEFHE